MSDRSFPIPLPHGAPRRYASLEAVLLHAAGHARTRLLNSCEAMSLIGALALHWKKKRMPVFTIVGAKVQDATAGSGEQAAHLLPGQILIDDTLPWELVVVERLNAALWTRFMVTAAVPIPFNTADSAVEKAGLKEAFRKGCERAWLRAIVGDRGIVSTYQRFLGDADQAFADAETAKKDKRRSATDEGDSRTSDERFAEIFALHGYRLHGVSAHEAATYFPFKPYAA